MSNHYQSNDYQCTRLPIWNHIKNNHDMGIILFLFKKNVSSLIQVLVLLLLEKLSFFGNFYKFYYGAASSIYDKKR